jgi:hypothetical protein
MKRGSGKPHTGRLLIGAVAVSVSLIGAALIFHATSAVPLPVIKFAGVEPAGIFEDSGQEMLIVSLSISSSSNRPPGRTLFAKQSGRTVEAKVGDQWVEVDAMLWTNLLVYGGTPSLRILLLPAQAEACRIRLQYSRALISQAQSWWLIKRLPSSTQNGKVSFWLRDSPYKAFGGWHKVTVEVPLPIKPLQRPGNPA